MKKIVILTLVYLFIYGCEGIPENIFAVTGFDVQEYVGTWHEIARLDHSFEEGLSNVTATYTLRNDGGLDVLNKGFDQKAGKWKEVKGKAFFVSHPDVGMLKVSFWGPFYGGYNIIALDKEKYSYAVICGSNKSYLWILARDKQLGSEILKSLIDYANSLGFETDRLIFVDHGNL